VQFITSHIPAVETSINAVGFPYLPLELHNVIMQLAVENTTDKAMCSFFVFIYSFRAMLTAIFTLKLCLNYEYSNTVHSYLLKSDAHKLTL